MSDLQKKLLDAIREKKLAENITQSESENVQAKNIITSFSDNIIRAFGTLFGPSISSFGQSTISKDIIIVPTAGTAASQNTYSQIDFKFIKVNNSNNNLDHTEVKTSLYNWGERASGNTFDTPVLVIGGSWAIQLGLRMLDMDWV